MAKESYEDLHRHRLDKAENNRLSNVLHAYRPTEMTDGEDEAASESYDQASSPIQWSSVKWQSLQVGDIVRIQRDEAVPADIALLHSKGDNNIAYIETMALDRETNLKTEQPPAALIGSCACTEAIAALRDTEVVAEDPNSDLYNFNGRMSVNGTDATPLINKEMIYRGSVLRNTPEVTGFIIYSGEECKIRMNANKSPRVKASSLQARVNKIVIIMVMFVICLALFETIAYQMWAADTEKKAWYLTHARVQFGYILVSFVIM